VSSDEPTLKLADIIRDVMRSTGRTRDVALFRTSQDVVETLALHYAVPTNVPSVPDALRGLSVETLRERVREQPAIAFLFGTFRNDVLEYEETCARKLEVLRGTARNLLRLRDLAHTPTLIESLLSQLGSFVHSAWGRDLDVSADRGWSLRVSRRYDLLPRAWREL
jgi:hypothetical protein